MQIHRIDICIKTLYMYLSIYIYIYIYVCVCVCIKVKSKINSITLHKRDLIIKVGRNCQTEMNRPTPNRHNSGL